MLTAAAVVALLLVATRGSGTRGGTAQTVTAAPRTVAAAFAILERAETAIKEGAASPAQTGDPTPFCAPPAMPAPTYPTPQDPTEPYGVPFLAEITGPSMLGPLYTYPAAGAKLLGGWDIAWATWDKLHPNNPHHVEVWKAVTWNIYGWATGLLELPSLSSSVSKKDIVFCTQGGSDPSPSLALPGGVGFPVGAFVTNNLDLYNLDPKGSGLLPLNITLAPTEPATLKVTGVDASGALELAGTTQANVTAAGLGQTCVQVKPDTLNLSTQSTGTPSTAPPGVSYPITPEPLTGQIEQSGATLTSNDIAIPRFEYVSKPTKKYPAICELAAALNQAIAGFGSNGLSVWPCGVTVPNQNCKAVAGEPGWAEFGADVQISKIDLPSGPPAGFSF